MSAPSNYRHIATLCHASSNVCPEVYVSDDADELKRVMITDDFNGKIFISHEQFELLKATQA